VEQVKASRVVNPDCEKIREYCSYHSVAMMFKQLCEGARNVYPNYRTWACNVDPVESVVKTLQSEGYIEEILPIVKMMLGSNFGNPIWRATVAIGIAIGDTTRHITYMMKAQEVREGVKDE